MHAAPPCFTIVLRHPQCITGSTHGSDPLPAVGTLVAHPTPEEPAAAGVGRFGSAMEPLSQAALAKLARDLKDLQQNAIDGVKVGGLWAGWFGWVRGRRRVRMKGGQGVGLHSGSARRRRQRRMFGIDCRPHSAYASSLQVVLNDDNLADLQAEYEGPGRWEAAALGREVPWPQGGCSHTAGRASVGPLPLCSTSSPLPRPCLRAAGTPYEGGLFRMRLAIGPEFPNAPPKGAQTLLPVCSVGAAH